MLTDMIIKKLKAEPGKRTEYWDIGEKSVQGLGIRIGKKKVFFIKYVFEGRARRKTIGEYPGLSLAEARAEAQKDLVSIQQGVDPGEVKQQQKAEYANEPTVAGLIGELWDKKLSKLKSGKATKRLLEKDLIIPWGKKKISSIKTRDIVLLLDQVGERAPVTRNRLHTAISGMFSFAVSRGVIDISPCANIHRAEEQTRDRVLNDDEVILLWRALDLENKKAFDAYPLTKLALKLILLTGQRPGEVAGMELSELTERPDGIWWEIPAKRMKGKNAMGHDVPLNPMAFEVIEQAMFYSGKSKFVFRSTFKKDTPLSVRAISRAVVRHLPEMKLEKFTPHDLRRTCRTGLATLKVSDVVAEKILSHRLQGVLGVYNRATYEPERRAALVLWENHIKGLIDPDSVSGNQGITDLNSYRTIND
ncbi:tyrosine-type recombinase/integrase [Desulfobacter sp.]|uniref:tyrosine-type recombinase/integrase n=1 Tax=Desulfobacter sp. TaxID=2294 RepID=UPI003D0E176E